MTNSTKDTEHKRIWLQPKCCGEHEFNGRQWAEDQPWEECDCLNPTQPVEYVRADLAQSLSDRIDVLTRELEAAGGIFRAYEALHLEKETEDGRRKAKVNGAYAESIERTLAALHQEATAPGSPSP